VCHKRDTFSPPWSIPHFPALCCMSRRCLHLPYSSVPSVSRISGPKSQCSSCDFGTNGPRSYNLPISPGGLLPDLILCWDRVSSIFYACSPHRFGFFPPHWVPILCASAGPPYRRFSPLTQHLRKIPLKTFVCRAPLADRPGSARLIDAHPLMTLLILV